MLCMALLSGDVAVVLRVVEGMPSYNAGSNVEKAYTLKAFHVSREKRA